MLINGQWKDKWDPIQAKDDKGRFIRQDSQFRNWITPDGRPGPTGEGGFAAESDRYHLYVAMVCPWACRTLMVRRIKKLEDIISVDVASPVLTEQSWRFGDFPGASADSLNGAEYVHEIYSKSDPTYSGRVTVPVLWDKQQQVIVSNESADIVRMLNSAFDGMTGETPDLYPAELRDEIDALNDRLYSNFNNGVYQAGFAQSQEAYEEAYNNVFATLDEIEQRLSDGRRYLFGDALTETDVRLFVTLVRFDLGYYGLFKCNRNLVAQMPSITSYIERVKASHGLEATVDPAHIKAGYYSIKALNPSGIVPLGPEA